MRLEKIYKREDGSKAKVIASFYADFRDSKWSFEVEYCEPRKRTWKSPVDNNGYEYRRLSMEDRAVFSRVNYLKYVSKQEVFETMTELWNNLKPSDGLINI